MRTNTNSATQRLHELAIAAGTGTSRAAEMDLVSASTEKLEPLPESSSQQLSSSEKEEEKKWLEDITEKAGRGGDMVKLI